MVLSLPGPMNVLSPTFVRTSGISISSAERVGSTTSSAGLPKADRFSSPRRRSSRAHDRRRRCRSHLRPASTHLGGYRLELERYRPLDVALQSRRGHLFKLLLEWGADLKDADVYTVLNTYNGIVNYA